eukprot:1063931_1
MSAFLSQFLCTLTLIIILKPIYGQTCVKHTQSLPVAVRGHTVIYSSTTKNAYIFGGDPAKTEIYKWDLHGAFETIGSIPQSAARFYTWSSNAVLIDDIIWFIGMRHKASYESDLIFKYNVITEQWEDTSSLLGPPVPLSYGCLATNNTHTFLVDGQSDNHDRNPRVLQIYNIAKNQWTTRGTPYNDNGKYEWMYQYCYMVNNDLFTFAGKFEDNSGPTLLLAIHKYKPHLNQWTALGFLPTMTGVYGGKTVLYNDVLYLVGDYYRAIIREFNIKTQTAADGPMALPISVWDAGVILVDNVIYVFGGRNRANTQDLSDIQYCTMPSQEPTALPSVNPSAFPSVPPSANPSEFPSKLPSANPSTLPSVNPSRFPSTQPSANPSAFPSVSPSAKSPNPSAFPSISPSTNPSILPSFNPSTSPSANPFAFPSVSPSAKSSNPSIFPSANPSNSPSSNRSLSSVIPAVYKNGEAEVVDETTQFIENSSDDQSEYTPSGIMDVVVLIVVLLVVIVLCAAGAWYFMRRRKKMSWDVGRIDNNAANNNTDTIADDDDMIAGIVCNYEESTDEEDIIAGVNTLGGDALCNNQDLERVADDQNVIAGVTLGEDVLCDTYDLEGGECDEVIMDENNSNDDDTMMSDIAATVQ